MRVTSGILLGYSPLLPVDTVHPVQTLKDVGCCVAQGPGRVFGQNFALEDAIGSHACSLEARTCVWPMAFLAGTHFLTGSHCKLRANTEGQRPPHIKLPHLRH